MKWSEVVVESELWLLGHLEAGQVPVTCSRDGAPSLSHTAIATNGSSAAGLPPALLLLDDLVWTNKHQQEMAISTNTFLNSALLVVQKYYTAPHQHAVPSRGIC